ncbi:WD40-repeat-containing domain protein, partial [Baffinella frigidus]
MNPFAAAAPANPFAAATPAAGAFGAAPAFGGAAAQPQAATQGWVAGAGQERFVVGSGHKGSVASLSWSPTVDNPQEALCAITDWDGDVTVLKLSFQQTAQGKFAVAGAAPACPNLSMQAGPMLCSAWTKDHKVALGGGDGQLRLWELAKGNGAESVTRVGTHDAGIKAILALDETAGWGATGLVTGSWDQSVALWDHRTGSGQPAARWRVGCKVFGLDGSAPYILVAGSERRILVYDIRKPGEPLDAPAGYSPCRTQTRAACFIPPAAQGGQPKGFAAGSVDGHVGACLYSPATPQPGGAPLQRVIPAAATPGAGVFPVNCVSMVPTNPGQEAKYLFAAAGDGRFA